MSIRTTDESNVFEVTRGIYPDVPGAKVGGTSEAAAVSMRPTAEKLRDQVLALLRREAMTADEVAAKMEESVLSIRPRVSELRKLEKITDTGKRRCNVSWRSANVWRATELL